MTAPASEKNAWLVIFYMCIPAGTALGYAYGGLVGNLNWRYAFWGEAILMLSFAVLGFVMEPLQLKGYFYISGYVWLVLVMIFQILATGFADVGELFVFATQAPVYYVFLHSVEPSLRPMSMAISTVLIHIFGDVPSSPLVGVLQDYVDNWKVTALILTSILSLAAGIWLIGNYLLCTSYDFLIW